MHVVVFPIVLENVIALTRLQAVLRTKLRMAKSLVPICDFWHEVILIFWFIS